MRYRRITPYTTKSGVQIGLRYEPPQLVGPTKEELHIQRALIPPGRDAVLTSQDKWYAIALAIFALALVLVYWNAPA